jgi:membrane peptidoglycan carboxypeptidase
MIRAMSALANGGKVMQPHVVSSIEYLDGSKKQIEPVEIRTVIKPETSAEITRMMVHVFDNYFDGTKKLDHYSIAGKTGTAQIANRATGGYYDDRNMHTFVGYFPAYDPKFIVFEKTSSPLWDPDKITFTRPTVSDWNESNTVKYEYDGVSIGEFQVHNKRDNFKFRFNMSGINKLITENRLKFS